jgi:23S rRNA (uracil1939-C5)-methyltransferase
MSEITIEKLGSEGDGIGRLDGRPVYVAGALPGELVRIAGDPAKPQLLEILDPSKDRRTPPCPYFGRCGGCTFQHASPEFMLDWKQREVAFAFSRAGITADINSTIATPAASRRRVIFSASRNRADGNIDLGFNEHGGATIVNISSCAILLPVLQDQISQLRNLAKTLIRGNEIIQIAVNVCDNGLDTDFHLPEAISETMTASFVRAMAKTPYLRGCINGEVVFEKEKPQVSFGRATVVLPPRGFLQAVREAESQMAQLVCQHLGGRKRVVDLFSGSGTFSLRLAEHSKVHAVEMEAAALSAQRAASGLKGLKPVTLEQRDLFDLPLTAKELKPYDGLCLDPPRAGAEDQVIEIAKTNIRSLAYVSCNPATLARDAAQLIAGGFSLQRVVPIDQFVYSPHIEVVALFNKKPAKANRSIFR